MNESITLQKYLESRFDAVGKPRNVVLNLQAQDGMLEDFELTPSGRVKSNSRFIKEAVINYYSERGVPYLPHMERNDVMYFREGKNDFIGVHITSLDKSHLISCLRTETSRAA